MKIVWSESARADLRAITSYIATRNPSAAKKWARKLRAVVEQLGRFPYSRHAVFDDDDSFCEIRHDKYRIFYSVAEGSIFISRIWHGARRRPWEPELDDE